MTASAAGLTILSWDEGVRKVNRKDYLIDFDYQEGISVLEILFDMNNVDMQQLYKGRVTAFKQCSHVFFFFIITTITLLRKKYV